VKESRLMDPDIASLRKSLAIYKGLVEVSGLIGAITDFDELLRAILDVARRVLASEAASLFFVNGEGGGLEMVVSSHVEGIFLDEPIRVPKGRGIAGWVFEHGKSLLVPDAYADSRFFRDADRHTGFHTRSILCAPLQYGGKLIGVIQLLNPKGKTAFEPEDLEGLDAYADLTATAIEKLRALDRLRQQERVERDLAIASEIQSELLACAIPPEVPGATFAAFNRAASNVGGDFYDVFIKNSREVYFAIGDVSGKGISASLLMAQTLSVMRFVYASASSPGDGLARLNAALRERIVRGMFVTMLLGRFDPVTGRVELASAGHCHPVLRSADGTARFVETDGALPLGIVGGVDYRQCAFDMRHGDMLILYTDGLSESKASGSDEFFEPHIIPAIGSHTSPRNIIQALVGAEKGHRGEAPPRDDLTLLVGGPR
jgi:phosphoserine phosphatase RsbU/P